MEQKKLTFNDLLMEKGTFKATGTIVAINGESNKEYKSGFVGSTAEITLTVNGVKQKVKIFGGIGKSETKVNVFQKDGEGKVAKDGNNKAIKQSIFADQFNPAIHLSFEKKEVMEWGERGEDGKANKIEHISELTSGRFANQILAKKDFLIGKRVTVEGTIRFKPTQKYDKIEANIEISKITLQKVEEGKTYKDMFLIQTPIIVDKSGINTIESNKGLIGYVPVYHKYIKPITKEGKEVKGRNVYVPFAFTVNDNGFMMMSADGGYSVEDRAMMLSGKLESKSQGAPFAIFTGILNYKSGMIEREITVEELADDPTYGFFAKRALNSPSETREQEVAKFKEMYKAQNPATVKGEFKQQIDFLTVNQVLEFGDKVAGIARESFEVYNLAKIKEEDEIMNQAKEATKTTQTQTNNVMPNVATNNTSKVSAPSEVADISSFNFEDDFPFN